MKFSTFDLAIDALRIIAENEERAHDAGIEIQGLTDPMINALMAVVEECYAGYCGQDIGYFCWELDFGRKWRPGRVTDCYGRDVRMSNVRELYEHLEHEKNFKTEWSYPGDGRIVGHGRYKGMDYFLFWNDSWWCAYVDVTGTQYHDIDYNKINELTCHGGLTFSSPYLGIDEYHSNDEKRWYLGWDYAHLGDDDITANDALVIEKEIVEFIKQLEVNN